ARNAGGQTAVVASYRVYVNGVLDGSTASTSYTIDGLTSGVTYTAKVEAVDGAGNQSTDGPSITFTTLKPLPPGGTFWDDNDSVHEGNIEAIAAQGITRGCNPPVNDQYCPEKNVTRGQMAAFLVRALNLTDDGGGNTFIDDDGSTFEDDIAKLAAAGITRGCNPPANTMYCPDKNVTRGQMAAFLVRALNLTDDGGGNTFIDDDGSTFEDDIAKLAAAGITLGCNPPTNDRYCPDNAVKRGQMASFLARALNLSPIIPPDEITFGDGVWTVPAQVPPGTYRNSDSSNFCEWKRLSGFGGGDADVIEDWLTQEIDIVTIAPTDVGFSSEDCGTWSSDLSPRTTSPTADFGGGTFQVGSEVAAGTWRNSDSSGNCYWERLSGFGGSIAEIIDNEFSASIQTVTLMSSDLGFSSERCGTWTKIS
nr:S-layer homology domain-containing protein [Acidimicrobiia bacterium]